MRDFRSSLLKFSTISSGKPLIMLVKRDFNKSLLTAKLWRELREQGWKRNLRAREQLGDHSKTGAYCLIGGWLLLWSTRSSRKRDHPQKLHRRGRETILEAHSFPVC